MAIFNGIISGIENIKKFFTPQSQSGNGISIGEMEKQGAIEEKTPIIQTKKPIKTGIGVVDIPNTIEQGKEIYEDITNKEDIRKEEETKKVFDEAEQKALEQQKRLWEREDAIRKETQQREDTAYQRAVADMKKAGINVNLLGVNPANSGGGITQASRIDNTSTNEELNLLTQEIIKEMSNEFEFKENEKDRFADLLGSAFNMLLMKALLGK